MAAGTLEVTGGKQLRRDLKRAGVTVAQLKEVHAEAAEVVKAAADRLVPRRSGALAASMRASGTQTYAVIRAGGARKVPYAAPIHWGWPRRGLQSQPWITDAAESTEAKWVQTYLDHVDAIIRSVEGTTT